jgi:DNA-3-methyladenine glycosylase
MSGQKLPAEFYQRKNVTKIARDLLGKALFTNIDGVITGGLIVETEAYSWKERGCHAYNNRKTDRNAIMFAPGGFAYVYLCYGIHYLFNVVTNMEGIADAVLIRAMEPLTGKVEMTIRRGRLKSEFLLTSGPGKLTGALGINRTFNGKSLLGNEVWIADVGVKIRPSNIVSSPRIGIDYAGEDAFLPWRYYVRNNAWVSKRT